MGSHSMDLKVPASEVFSEVQKCIGTTGFQVKEVTPNQSITSKGNREFSWVIVIILAILIWPAALVYYFTRQRSSVTATLNSTKENECHLTMSSNGEAGDDIIEMIEHVFEDEKS
jgi:hypothetical protein